MICRQEVRARRPARTGWGRAMGRSLGLVMALATTVTVLAPAQAGPLETLERERAVMLATWLDPSLSDDERFERVRSAERRLVDFERILLRDDSGSKRPSRDMRLAFESYDRTFLVHAALERETSVFAHWLEQLGFTSVRILGAEVGRR